MPITLLRDEIVCFSARAMLRKFIHMTLILTRGVIPAPYQVQGKLQRESGKKLDSGSSPE